ncbi:hypothetical protein EMN47_10460 [Prolixibacteraceae bacterium JC049]|nr:hypothetical protein [Prolixibacteraceae bacterium JC049]
MSDFKDRMSQLTDEQLITVLRSKSGYREEAYEAAVEVALEREILKSKEDLTLDKFKEVVQKRQFLSFGGSEEQLKQVKGSLIRSLMIVGLIPMIYFVMGFLNKIEITHWYALGVGLLWSGVLFYTKKHNKSTLLGLLPLAVAGSVLYRFFVMGSASMLDIVVLSILFIIVVFVTLFLRKTINALK